MSLIWKGILSSVKRNNDSIALIILLTIAFILRFYGINWDSGHLFHPDERAILMKVNELSFPVTLSQFFSTGSPLNPHWFSYGSLPLYLLKIAANFFSIFIHNLSVYDLRIIGRTISAFLDVGTVLLVYIIGLRYFNRLVGLLAATFITFAVIHIQLSHFYAVDSLLTFFIVAAFFFLIRFVLKGGLKFAMLSGFFAGCAIATKISAAPLFFTLLVAYILYNYKKSTDEQKKTALGLALAVLAAVATFTLFEPYAVIDRYTFLKDTLEQSDMVRRLRDYPYTRQYVGTVPFIYQVWQLTVWGLGIPLGGLVWLSLLFNMVSRFANRNKIILLLLSWVLPYFLLTGGFQVKFLRYLLPITPFLALMSGIMISRLIEVAGKKGRVLIYLLTAVTVAVTIFYSLAFVQIYTRPHTAVQASEWVRQNVPPGSIILKEHWDESLPGLNNYTVIELEMYDYDSAEKVSSIINKLEKADYLVLFSNRLYGTIPRLPDKYPFSTNYYRDLFSGKLGYQPVYFASSYPGIMGITLTDDTFTRPALPVPLLITNSIGDGIKVNPGYADESFTVYDHPKILIFKKVESLSFDRIWSLLTAPQRAGADESAGKKNLTMTAEESSDNQAGGTWTEIFKRDSLANSFPLITWLLAVEIFSLVILPFSFLLFRKLRDRGYMAAKAMGILAVAYLSWLPASIHLLTFSRQSTAYILMILAFVSLIAGLLKRKEIGSFFKNNWKLLLFEEFIFIASFLLFYVIRDMNPDLWHPIRGGEKPMDFAYLNAIIKSTYMPPYDPWFSGGYLNYYYFGHFILATITKFTGIIPAVAFNLAVPLLFALTFSGAFSLTYNIFEKYKKWEDSNIRTFSRSVLFGILAAVFVTVLGNIDGLIQVLQGLAAKLMNNQPFLFDYWRSSRMMPPTTAITEFPFFSFLFADLHAHLIALPFTILALTGIFALAASGHSDCVDSLRRKNYIILKLPLLIGLAFILGALRVINSWDFPSYFVLSVVILVISDFRQQRPMKSNSFILPAGQVLLVYLVSYYLYYPFHQHYQLFYFGFTISEERTLLPFYLAIYGLFLFPIIIYLVSELVKYFKPSAINGIISIFTPRLKTGKMIIAALVFTALILLIFTMARPEMSTIIFTLTLALIFLPVYIKTILDVERDNIEIAALSVIGLAFALSIAVDIFTLKGDIDRMNTVFKFYLQVWVLYAAGSSYALWKLTNNRNWADLLSSTGKKIRAVFFLFLFLSGLIYPALATPARIADRFNSLPPTNDGMLYMKQAVYAYKGQNIELKWDYYAINWLQDNVKGSPVLIEGTAPLYTWGSRVSIYTGLPAVIGWDWHQMQQRWDYAWMVEERTNDVNLFYKTEDIDVARSIISKYNISYIYAGKLEQVNYYGDGLKKFDRMPDDLDKVYQNRDVTIYKVKNKAS